MKTNRKKKFKKWMNSPVTWGQSLKLSGISLIVGLLWCAVLWLWFKWDDFISTFHYMKKRLTELELWKSKKEREKDGA